MLRKRHIEMGDNILFSPPSTSSTGRTWNFMSSIPVNYMISSLKKIWCESIGIVKPSDEENGKDIYFIYDRKYNIDQLVDKAVSDDQKELEMNLKVIESLSLKNAEIKQKDTDSPERIEIPDTLMDIDEIESARILIRTDLFGNPRGEWFSKEQAAKTMGVTADVIKSFIDNGETYTWTYQDEIWYIIDRGEYKGYLITNTNRIFYPNRKRATVTYPKKHKPYFTTKSGYRCNVDRIICSAFNGPEPRKKPCVKHIDGNKLNNNPSNLKWTDKTGKKSAIPVYCFTKKGKFLERYDSIQRAYTKTGTDGRSISKCLTGDRKSAGGFLWSSSKILA